MALPFYNWSRTAASNATADSTVNWAEGQAPSSVNDSGRAMMASTAAYRDDVAGGITTGGSATAYTVTSYQVFDTLAHLAGQKIAFIPHATNTNAVGVDITLDVDGLGAKSIRMAPSVALPGGTLILGTPYVVTYNNSDAVFYLQNMTNPYSIPLGGAIPFFGTTAPNSSFAMPYGQAISRTTYSTLFTIFSTTFGVGDGSTTFNVPDLRGRVVAGKDNMGGSTAGQLTSTYFGSAATTLGNTGGYESHTLTTAQLASHTHANSLTDPGHAHSYTDSGGGTHSAGGFSGGQQGTINGETTGSSGTSISITNASAGSGSAHNNVQPTIIGNYILRII